uniref:uncharacterized protein LOC120347196 n=1 Tax=Styela clava TaxID=7725 RepID=UPI00193A1608|nr:uncharacterized protein LOC120347196 [Styela clava]
MSQKLSSVIVTTRKVTNEETGIDLHVYEERKNFASKRTIRATVYNIIVVSNLQTLNAKAGETVQYTIDKSHDDCEKLHKNLSKKFPGTLIPEMPSKPIRMMDTAEKAKTRKSQVGNFLAFCAKTPKISKSEVVLKFLGVENVKLDGKSEDDEPSESQESPTPLISKPNVNLFTPAIDSSHEIFSEEMENQQEEEGEEEIDYTPRNLKKSKNKTEEISSSGREVKLFDDKDTDTPMIENAVVAQKINEVTTEQEVEDGLFDYADSDEDLDELLRKLENTKNTRQAREKDIAEKRKAAQNSNIKTAVEPEAGDFDVNDISKYISENVVNMNDLNLGL